MNRKKATIRTAVVALAALALASLAMAQAQGTAQQPAAAGRGAQAGRGRGGGRGPTVVSPEVLPDNRVVFRILAPAAQNITLSAGDIPGPGRAAGVGPGATPPADAAAAPAQPGGGRGGRALTKNDQGLWEATVGPVPPGAFRYVFMVDGVRTLDPVNTRISESNGNSWSLFYAHGQDFMDEKNDVPHGAVASIHYYSSVLKTMRRMHIYTPPGYETSSSKYPVFYLLHGAGDCDDSWTSVGRAGFILDNLIASKRAKPMIVVMPAGHQPGTGNGFGPPPAAPVGAPAAPAVSPFTNEFMTDMVPYVEQHYRSLNGRSNRAIAGLSMGGSQTLDIAFTHLDKFAYIGVFSSGAPLGGGGGRGRGAAPAASAAPGAAPAQVAPVAADTQPAPRPPQPDWEARHKTDLDNAALKKGTKLIWLSTGADDGLITNSRATVELLKKHGFEPVFKESAGAHTWLNWRDYLNVFAPQLFQ